MQNIYDNEKFYNGYMELRLKTPNANTAIEQPCIFSLLPDMSGKSILDLGCGTGESCTEYIKRGAKHVTGIDISEKMIKKAKVINYNTNIKYLADSIENYDYPLTAFDCVISSLAFHYVENLNATIKKIALSLTSHGHLIFSQEHPIITSTINPGWIKNNNIKLFWKLDNYFEESIRTVNWIIEGVQKFHRTVHTILNTIIEAGFIIQKIMEPSVSSDFLKEHPDFSDERRIPLFLVIKCMKKD